MLLGWRRFKIFQNIHWKFIMIYLLLILIAMQVIGAYFMKASESHYVNSFTRMLDQQASLFAYSVQNYLSDEEAEEGHNSTREDMNVFIDRIFSAPYVDVQVLDHNGVVIGASSDKQAIIGQKNTQIEVKRALSGTRDETIKINPKNGHRTKVISLPIKIDNEVVGAIYLMASMEDMYQTVKEINNILATGTMIALALTVGLGITLAQTITSPIKEMTEQATAMAEGDFTRQVKIYGKDEIGQLAQAFNELSKRLTIALNENAEEKNKLASILSHMSDGVVALDRQGCIILMNATAETLLGKKEDEVIGAPIHDILSLYEEDLSRLYEERDQRFLVEVNSNEQAQILQVNATPLKREGNDIQGTIMVLQDVTQQEKLEEERKEFVANVSHELRTPLTTMKSYLEALEDGVLQDQELAPRFVHVVQNETERMIRLVNDLLQLSKMDTKKIPLKLKHTNMHLLIREVVERFSIPLSHRELTAKLQLEDNLPIIEVDPDQMIQVFDNIMSNAIKYSNQGGSISVWAKALQQEVEITIADEGIGIPNADLKNIFKRFYRVDKARSREMGGTGLGLAIAREIIKAHQGRIMIESVVGKGTKVVIRLPVEQQKRGEQV